MTFGVNTVRNGHKLWAGQQPSCHLFPPVSASSTLMLNGQQPPSAALSHTEEGRGSEWVHTHTCRPVHTQEMKGAGIEGENKTGRDSGDCSLTSWLHCKAALTLRSFADSHLSAEERQLHLFYSSASSQTVIPTKRVLQQSRAFQESLRFFGALLFSKEKWNWFFFLLSRV